MKGTPLPPLSNKEILFMHLLCKQKLNFFFLDSLCFSLFFFFLAARGSFQARDQTCAAVATCATAAGKARSLTHYATRELLKLIFFKDTAGGGWRVVISYATAMEEKLMEWENRGFLRATDMLEVKNIIKKQAQEELYS